jgi:hypothetical protein
MQDFELENQLATQRYQKALAAQQQSGRTPMGEMVGNRYVKSSPFEHLAEALRLGLAGREANLAKQEIKDLQGKKQTAMADALRTYTDKATGAPAVASTTTPTQMPSFDEADAASMQGVQGYGATTGAQAARAPDLRGAYGALMNAPDAAMRSAGMTGMARIPELEAAKLEKDEARQFRRDEAAATRQARMDELKMRMEDQRNSQAERLAAQKEMRQMQMDFQRQNQQLIAANRPERQPQILQTDQGFMQFVGGQAVPIMGPGGVPVKGKAGPEKEPTEGERKAGTLLQRLRGSQEQLSTVLEKNPNAASPNFTGQALSGMGMESLGNLVTSGDRQRVNAAQLDMLDAALTLGTGAAYTKEQLEGYRKSYFPQIGDSVATIADKQVRLKNVIDAAELAAGKTASKAVPKAPAAPTTALSYEPEKESRYQQWLKSQGR